VPERAESRRWRIALAGAVALAVAMGIGRFAFTPLLPMMLHDGVIDMASASWLASANYLGYLAGALLCTFEPWLRARLVGWPGTRPTTLVRAGLAVTVVLTLLMALPWAATWPLLRFLAGVASAFVFVHTSGWCLAQLAGLGSARMGGLIYIGPGAGIVVSGVAASAMVGWHWRAAGGWALFGALAAWLTAMIWAVFDERREPRGAPAAGLLREGAAPAPSLTTRASPTAARLEVSLLAFAYGLAGFGYIISATFLPVIARDALPGSAWLDLFWPLFGLGVMVGAALATQLPAAGDRRLLLAGAYLIQAAGIATTLWRADLAGFAFGSLMLGLPFTAITFFAMQEVRRLRPALVAAFMGLLTALYGIGQILGPPLVAVLMHRGSSVGAGFRVSLEIAMAALVVGALIYITSVRLYPLRRPTAA